jgi:Domain of unknown function (DUF4129)
MTIGLRAVTFLAILSFAGFAAGGEAPLSLAGYKSRLELYGAQIRKVGEHPEYAVDFHREVPSALQVQTQSGVFTVSMDFLHNGLETFLKSAPSSKPTILSQLAGRIKAMGAEADSFEHARDGDPAARDRLNRILSAHEFGRVRGPTELELIEARIRDWLNKKLDKLFPSAPDLDQLGQIFVWIVIAVVSSILAVWLYRQSRERLLDTPKEITPFVPSAKGWRTWLAEAREKADLGEWRDAIHLGFWAAVSRLESDGVWRPDKARTPREYLHAIPSASANKPSFAAATKTFEAAWYGGRPASAGDFDRFLAELEKLGCRG